jgi:hypothetical protein
MIYVTPPLPAFDPEGARSAVDSGFGAIKAEAISRLQAALVSGNAVSEAIRWAFYRNPSFMFALFAAAIGDRFGSGADLSRQECTHRRSPIP